MGGWASALGKAGLTIDDIASTEMGLPESDRVAK
jgi:hypothetical protein